MALGDVRLRLRGGRGRSHAPHTEGRHAVPWLPGAPAPPQSPTFAPARGGRGRVGLSARGGGRGHGRLSEPSPTPASLQPRLSLAPASLARPAFASAPPLAASAARPIQVSSTLPSPHPPHSVPPIPHPPLTLSARRHPLSHGSVVRPTSSTTAVTTRYPTKTACPAMSTSTR